MMMGKFLDRSVSDLGTFGRPSMPRQFSSLSQMSNMSLTSAGRRKRNKKAALWTEKNDGTTVVFGPIHSHESFKSLFVRVKAECQDVKSHYFREAQSCGFVYFHSENGASQCKKLFNASTHEGQNLIATCPSQYFQNEEDAFPETYKAKTGQTNSGTNVSGARLTRQVTNEPTATLVLKNLCFGLKQDKMLDFMTSLPTPPQSVSYHFDGNGLFRGVAFAKYNSAEEAARAMKELAEADFGGRRLKAEFKRRTTTQLVSQNSTLSAADGSPPGALRSQLSGRSDVFARSLTTDSQDMASSPPRDGIRMHPMSLTPIPKKSKPANVVSLFDDDDDATKGPVTLRGGLEFEEMPEIAEMRAAEESKGTGLLPPPPEAQLTLDAAPVIRMGLEFS